MAKTVAVAAAIIMRDGRLFATQRGYGAWKDWWELPGGKLEAGESPEDALRREISEELDTLVDVGGLFATVEYDYPDFHLSMRCFPCTVRSGSLTLREHEGARWLSADELHDVRWLPADEELLPRLAELLAGHSPAGR